LTSDEILKIARLDAEKAYRQLAAYVIHITLADEDSVWKVEYELKDKDMEGGGASYQIDPYSGEILSKKYYQ